MTLTTEISLEKKTIESDYDYENISKDVSSPLDGMEWNQIRIRRRSTKQTQYTMIMIMSFQQTEREK